MNKLKSLFLVLVVLFSTTGCATIFGGGSTEVINVESSSPIKLKVVGSDGEVTIKTTPFSHQITRSKEYTIKLFSDQYESSDIFINKSVVLKSTSSMYIREGIRKRRILKTQCISFFLKKIQNSRNFLKISKYY